MYLLLYCQLVFIICVITMDLSPLFAIFEAKLITGAISVKKNTYPYE